MNNKMELRELTKKVLSLFSASNPGELPAAIKRVCISNDFSYYSRFCDLVGDLGTDWMQMVFQFYLADRKEKKQDFTPKSICSLLSALTECSGGVVYDLCAGSGALTIQKWANGGANKTYICEEWDEQVIPILIFNMAVRNMDGYVVNRNALTLETKGVFKITKGNRFSTVEQIAQAPTIVANEIISNPPYNIKWDAPEPLTADSRFFMKPIPPASNANYAFVLSAISCMAENCRCAFVLPAGALSGAPEQEIREYLIDARLLERVISLPDRMFESTSIGTCVLVFSKGTDTVKMFDLRKKASQEQRDQNGQFGGASHENRTYHKTVNVLSDDVIASACGGCDDVPGFSKETSHEEIRANDYILAPSRYIRLEETEQSHRAYADIISDINRIARERSVVKLTMNETLAKQFGLYEVAQAEREGNDSSLNKLFSSLGGRYEGRRYLVLSKAKNEFKVENQDKDILSSLFTIFLPMWKQHVYFLNQEENRLLAELRDAMLPDLMSGKLVPPEDWGT